MTENVVHQLNEARTVREVLHIPLPVSIHHIGNVRTFKKFSCTFGEQRLLKSDGDILAYQPTIRCEFLDAATAYEGDGLREGQATSLVLLFRKGRNRKDTSPHTDLAQRPDSRIYLCSNVAPTLVLPHDRQLAIFEEKGLGNWLDSPFDEEGWNAKILHDVFGAKELEDIFAAHASPYPANQITLISGITYHRAQNESPSSRVLGRVTATFIRPEV